MFSRLLRSRTMLAPVFRSMMRPTRIILSQTQRSLFRRQTPLNSADPNKSSHFNFYMFILLFNVCLFVVWNFPFFKYLCEISYSDQYYERVKHMEMIDPGTRLAPEINMHYADIQDANPSNITNYSYNFQMDDVDHSDAAANIDQNSNIYKVYFKTSSSSSSAVEFFPLQDHVYCIPNETTMVFFQAYNPTPNQVTGISIYMINPTEAAPYVNKVQCFCFEDMMLQPYETVELPVLFMLDADIKNKLQFDRKNVTINYIMFAK